ncbi:MAG: phosphoribosyl-ATP diphosphatase [Oscillospiraceae bacterium]|nr:phosphoribosyl-ATP diphosphatase [Oscillospiraceae bacterium]
MNNIFNKLYDLTCERKNSPVSNSYTGYLFEKGLDKILKKCGEECSEVIIAAKNGDNGELKNEIADLIYHLIVLCAERGLKWSEIEEVLSERGKKTGNLKQFHNTENDVL